MANRVYTGSEAKALRYQAQGSSPKGDIVGRTYTLYDTIIFNSSSTEYNLFGSSAGQSSEFLTNMIGANSIPGGQSFTAFALSLNLYIPAAVATADVAATINAFYDFCNNSLWKFARANEDWSAKFHGSKFLPTVAAVSETAGNRVGDFVKSGAIYKMGVPVVIGQNTSFGVNVRIPSALAAANLLVTGAARLKVNLDGFLAKKNAT